MAKKRRTTPKQATDRPEVERDGELVLGELEVLSTHSRKKERRIQKPKTAPKFELFADQCLGHRPPPYLPLPDPTELPTEVFDLFDPNVVFEQPDGLVEMDEREYMLAVGAYYAWAATCLQRHPSWARRGRQPFEVPRSLLKTVEKRSKLAGQCRVREAVWVCKSCDLVHGAGRPESKCDSLLCPRCRPVLGQQWVRAVGSFVRSNPPRRYSYSTCTVALPKSAGLSVPRLRLDYRRLQRTLDWLWGQAWSSAAPGWAPGEGIGPGLLATIEVSPAGAMHAHIGRHGVFVPDAELERLLLARDTRADSHAVKSRVAWTDQMGDAAAIEQHQQYAEKGSKLDDVGETGGGYQHPLLVVLTEIALFRQRRHLARGDMIGVMTSYKKTIDAEVRVEETRACLCGSTERRWVKTDVRPERIDPAVRQAFFDRRAEDTVAEAERMGVKVWTPRRPDGAP